MPLFGAPGERIGYEVYPHPEGAPPLVLIHGFTASRASFEANIDGLREHFTVITVELLGHGDSEAPADPVFYRTNRAVQRLLQLFDHLGYQRVLLCGHSLGGALALRLALDAPEWVAGLIVINSSSAAGDPAWRDGARPRMEEMGARVRAEGTSFMKQTRLYPAHSKRLDPKSRELLTQAFDRLTPDGVAGTAEALVVDVNAWERHPQLSTPFLLVVGEKDADFAPAAPAFLSRFPEGIAREVRLPAAGHAANIEQAPEFELAVVQFAREIAYLRAPAPENNRVLMALGGALVFAGLGLLAAAVMFNGGGTSDDPQLLAAEPDVTQDALSSPTPVAQVAGTVAQGQPTRPSVVNVSTATVAPSSTAPAVVATATVTAPRPAPTATPAQDDEEDAPTATPEATATPTTGLTATATVASGPFAALSGPSTAGVGDPVTVYASYGGGSVLRTDITLPNGQVQGHSAGATWVPNSPGCYVFSVLAYFANGQTRTGAHAVAVGGATCGQG